MLAFLLFNLVSIICWQKKALVCLLTHLVYGDVVLVRRDVEEERPQLLALQVAHAGDAVLHDGLFLFYLLLFTDCKHVRFP